MWRQETAEKQLLEAVDKASKKTRKVTEEVSKRNEFLSGYKRELKKMLSTILSICRMLACVNISIIIFRKGLSVSQKRRRLIWRQFCIHFLWNITENPKQQRMLLLPCLHRQRTPWHPHLKLSVEWETITRDFQLRMFRICLHFIVDCFILISFK